MASIHATRRALTRSLHSSSRVHNRVAPPHPISHMRPIIYDDAPGPSPPTLLRHPYSLEEFGDTSASPVDLELQLKLQRQQLDAFHHDFWLDNNIRYHAVKETTLSNLAEASTPLDKENALSEFNTHWYNQEKTRIDAYTNEWRRRNFALIRLSAKVELQRLGSRITSTFATV